MTNRATTVLRRRQDERREPADDHDQLPGEEEDANDERAGDPRRRRSRAARRVAAASPRWRRISRAVVATTAASRSSIDRGRGSSTASPPRPVRGAATARPRDRRGGSPRTMWVTSTIVGAVRSHSRSSSRSNRSRRQRVECAERLVQEEDSGLQREGPRERDALPHAARQLGRAIAVALRSSPTRSISAARRSSRRGRGHPASSSGYMMLSAAERHGSSRGSWNTSPIRGSGPVDRLAVERDSSPFRGEQAGDHAQQRRLAAAVRTDQGDDLAPARRRGRRRRAPGSRPPPRVGKAKSMSSTRMRARSNGRGHDVLRRTGVSAG